MYANLVETKHNILDDYHRMLYVFACLSDKCISKSDCVQVYRAIVPHDNDHIEFATDQLYNKVMDLTDE